jgi:hypothetical protein
VYVIAGTATGNALVRNIDWLDAAVGMDDFYLEHSGPLA